MKKTWWIVLLVLILDHGSKLWVKTNMMLNQEHVIFDWFRIHFTENNGMAFGIELFNKLFLTLFRIVLILALVWLVKKLHQNKAHQSIKVAFSMILGGAIGNVIDALAYGPLFTHSSHQIAEFTTTEGATPIFYGKVVDMLYFPLWRGRLPEWIPGLGGDYFEFFPHIFNLADTSISLGVVVLILFNKKLSSALNSLEKKKIKPTDN